MKRRYKFLIWIGTIWIMGIFPLWALIPDPHIASANIEGLIEGLGFVVAIVGGLVWVVWHRKPDGRV